MQQELNPVAEYLADHTRELAEMAKAARLDALAGILKMAQLEARLVAGSIALQVAVDASAPTGVAMPIESALRARP
jgi:hypothetical protein